MPEGIPFPRENDAQAVESFIGAQLMRGLLIWAVIFVALAVSVGIWWRL